MLARSKLGVSKSLILLKKLGCCYCTTFRVCLLLLLMFLADYYCYCYCCCWCVYDSYEGFSSSMDVCFLEPDCLLFRFDFYSLPIVLGFN